MSALGQKQTCAVQLALRANSGHCPLHRGGLNLQTTLRLSESDTVAYGTVPDRRTEYVA
jgi:hypothetical protein